jgi:O6-methylguanine-DNA--protein-cysteine methyltransferase
MTLVICLFCATLSQQSLPTNAASDEQIKSRIEQLEHLHNQEIEALRFQWLQQKPRNRDAALEQNLARRIQMEQTGIVTTGIENTSLRLKKAGASDGELQSLSVANEKAKQTGSLNDLAAAADRETQLAEKYGARVKVILKTIQSGATVKYQTLGERIRKEPAHTVGDPTNTNATLPLGFYYIWAERKQKPTSDIESFYTVQENPTPVTLNEQ